MKKAVLFLFLVCAASTALAAQIQAPVVPGQTESDVVRVLGQPEKSDVNVYSEKAFFYTSQSITVTFSPSSGLVSGVTLGYLYKGKIADGVDMSFTKDQVRQTLGEGTPIPEENFSDSEAYSWDLGGGQYALFQFWTNDAQIEGRVYRAGAIQYVEISS